ncbi:hypothetical protein [Prevotella histicola]|uniref:hypothetical protein n=1 Tax=Prevotella histicola TaxID=470565 RepID=UPI0028E8C1A5|nr:hypothetical protein [Prevotella histicola]
MFEKNSYERTLLITFSVVFLSLLGLYIIYPNEPEFINSYCILTSESSLEVLPKEIGTINSYQNNSPKLSSVVDKISPKQSAATNSIPSTNGVEIILAGPHSSYVIPKDMKTISLVIRAKDYKIDPMDLYRIVRFNSSKKDRRFQWMGGSPSLLGSEKAQKSGYVNFVADKYSLHSYILTIPEKEMIPGEYGIFLSAVNGTTIPIGTFSIPK